jgi:phosphoribosyl 1,2-cyclic phosphate phosphodiesterase
LEFYVKLSRHESIKLFLPPEALAEYHTAFPFLQDVFEAVPWNFGQTYAFNNLSLTPLPANHSIQTAGIFLESKRKLAYFTDTAGLPDSSIQDKGQ